MTPDPAAAKSFYDAVVGWEIETASAMPGGAVDYRMIRRADGGHAGGLLVLSPEMVAGGAGPAWTGYVHVPDVDEAAASIVDAGGTVHMDAQDMPGVGTMAMVADPWGAVFYVMQPTPPPDMPDARIDVFSPDRPQHVRWNELMTPDPAGAAAFYADLFGWRQEGSMPMGDAGDYLFLHRGDGMIGAIMPTPAPAESAGASWLYYFGVDDIDRAAAAVTERGGMKHGEIVQIPGGEFSLTCADPQGAPFGLVGPRKE
ncbi:VOC family protein [Altererythrobacter aerius]|uniref:VOC family protein n=2 Tax=Tsuneonella aeria TaxID=1837929 RepID=A0A6I4THA1_9SPHN|nr:VOC family protein [Tsuneonella aeria]MXO76046.1 VOC family protein [Tsuneonella aeria]